jgi:chorismate mutase
MKTLRYDTIGCVKMTEATVNIPEKEYLILLKYRKLVDAEFEEKFTEKFLEDVRKSEKAHQKGEYIRCSSREERDRLFESL